MSDPATTSSVSKDGIINDPSPAANNPTGLDPNAHAIAAAVAAALAATRSTADANTKQTKKSAGGMSKKAKKGPNFTQGEVDTMLELIDEARPLSYTQWELVAEEHRKFFPTTDRDAEGLRRKFNALAGRNTPTGDPFIPPDVKKAKKIRRELSEMSGLKTGSPEKDIVDLSTIHSKGGAMDNDSSSVQFSLDDLFNGNDDGKAEESDDNCEDEDDDESKNAARANLKQAAKKKMTPRKTLVTPVVVSKEFSSSFVTKNHNKKATKKKDDDDKDADEMKTFMQMFIMQSERERADREYEREERRRQAEIDREERRLQMAQTKATQDMIQLMLMRSFGMNAAVGSLETNDAVGTLRTDASSGSTSAAKAPNDECDGNIE